MRRALKGKIKVHGTLVAALPLSVGGMGAGEQVDLDLAVDGAGDLYVPGTSLAGPMRAWLASRADSDDVDKLFGFIKEQNDNVKEKSDDGQASALFVEDGQITTCARERRHGIAIEETSGTAKKHFFYTRAILPRGTCVSLDLEMDLTAETEVNLKALAAILKALQAGEIRFGACKTRGFGELKLEKDFEVDIYDFENPKDLEAWLNGERIGTTETEFFKKYGEPAEPNKGGERCVIEIKWRPASSLMVKSGRDGFEADMLPLVSGTENGRLVPVIPGSSIKGALRAQAYKILRTLFAGEEPAVEDKPEPGSYFNIAREIFGTTESAGRIAVDDVYCEASVSNEEWIEENPKALDQFSVHRQHVAIDRFTGGASDSALYSARPVKNEIAQKPIRWGPIRLILDLAKRCENELNDLEQNQIRALVTLLLRDLKEGMIPIGFGTRRGLGDVEICTDTENIFPDKDGLRKAWAKFVDSGGTFKDRAPKNKEEKK